MAKTIPDPAELQAAQNKKLIENVVPRAAALVAWFSTPPGQPVREEWDLGAVYREAGVEPDDVRRWLLDEIVDKLTLLQLADQPAN